MPTKPTCAIALFLLTSGTCWSQWTSTEVAKLVASAPQLREELGTSAALSGDTVVIGAPGWNNDQGTAYVFVRGGAGWGQQAQLTASDGMPDDHFGRAVAVCGDTIVVGADATPTTTEVGSAYVFVRTGTSRTQQAILAPIGGKAGDAFGSALAIEGDTVLVAARFEDRDDTNLWDVGAVYAFDRSGTAWTQTAKLSSDDGEINDEFGVSLSLSGDTLLIGAAGDEMDRGAAYVFARSGTAWSQGQKLTPGGLTINDRCGASVALSGDTILLGAPDAIGGGPGSAFVFRFDGASWVEHQKLTANNAQVGDQFGSAVALEGDAAFIGAWGDDHSGMTNAGSTFLFTRNNATWTQTTRLTASDADPFDYFGRSVAVSGSTVFIGANGDDLPGGSDEGSAYVFALDAPVAGYCSAGTSASGCQATLSASGVPSASAASGFSLSALAVEGSKDGLFFFGTSGRQANPWGNGTSYQCVVPPVRRAGLLTGVGTSGLCDGAFAQDLNALWCAGCPKPLHNPGAGATVQAQLWYRDPLNTSNQTTSLSAAVEFTVGP